jgi:hypothetical protein
VTELLPLNRDWVSRSLIWGEVALCRDEDGALWFCCMREEKEGWHKLQLATPDIIEGMRWTQRLAGKEPQPWPEGAPKAQT